jgi:predicted PurR-regulated permease PerM
MSVPHKVSPETTTPGSVPPMTSEEAVPVKVAPATPPGFRPRAERRSAVLGWRSRDILRAGALLAALFVVLQLVWLARNLLLVVFLGVLFGLAVESGVDRLQRWRIPRGVGAASIVLGFFALLFALGAAMAPTLTEQARVLQQRLPDAVEKVQTWLETRRSGVVGFILGDTDAPPRDPPAGAAEPPIDTAGRDTIVAVVSDQFSLRDRVSEGLGGLSRFLFPFLTSTAAVFGGIVLIVFLAIYIGAEPDTYHAGLMHLFPHRSRQRAGEVLSAMALVLRRWLVTQLIAMATIGVVITIILSALDVKAALALGVIAGLLEFVPTVGPILGALPAIAMGFIDSPEKALYVTLAFWAVQFVENNFLIPLLMKGGVNLAPALTLVSQAIMTLAFGFLGLMVAVPLLAAIMVPVKMLYVEDVVGDTVPILEDHENGGDG